MRPLFFILLGMILTLPVMAQVPPTKGQKFMEQRKQLLMEISDANRSGDQQKFQQLRVQLNTLIHQHVAQKKQLRHELREAVQNGEKSKAQQIKRQLMLL